MFIELIDDEGVKFTVNKNRIIVVFDVSSKRDDCEHKSDVLLVVDGHDDVDTTYLSGSYEEIKEKLGVK